VNAIPFVTLDDPAYGTAVQVSPLIRRVIAKNPSKFTYRGTGTYIVGHGDVVVIDPGPALPGHRRALERALQGERVTAILVTHCHADHSPLAAWLRATTGAPTVAFGPHAAAFDDDLFAGEDELDDDADREAAAAARAAEREASPEIKIEESIDRAFSPDGRVLDGMLAAAGDGWTLTAVHTPGHTSNHLCFALDAERALFTGDHVMGWSTTVIGPPDGDMRAYFRSLTKVQRRRDAVLWPTHGAPIREPRPFLEAFVAHRRERERQVLEAVRGGEESVVEMVRTLYADVRRELHKPARRSVLAHLIKLVDDGLVAVDPGDRPRLAARFHPV
jgi:glyoxylase-like metal-dependent hydrolase (beta-lactamase superfamily II)